MAGRSLFRRLLGNRSDTVGLDDVSTTPSPGGFTPVPYPNATDDDDATAVAKSTSLEDPSNATSQPVLAGERAVADAEPTAFDEADAVFGQRTNVSDANEVVPTESTSTVGAGDGLRDGIIEMNGIISPNNVVADPDDTAPALISDDGIVGMNGIVSPNNVVADPVEESEPLIDAGDGGRDSYIGMNGIIGPNNVVDDPDDDLVLADLSGGSIEDQLAANTGFSLDVAESGLTDDLDDLDDIDAD